MALTGATTADPQLADAQYALASLYASKGDATLARAHLEKYVTLAGDPAGVAARVAGEADFAPVRDDDGFQAWAATLDPPPAPPQPSAQAPTKRKRKAKARAPRKRPAPDKKGAAVTVPDF